MNPLKFSRRIKEKLPVRKFFFRDDSFLESPLGARNFAVHLAVGHGDKAL